VPPSAAEPGTEIGIDIRGRPAPARVVETPFFRRPRAGSAADRARPE
jgi:glycine cleavage system aminomethyltransferase T